ncbi:MMPL family transporter [Nocardioides sp. SR21]|uniref:MMPL family transporter n=1 Tax=Nocardioides sp. SR21 TaxID=2919501 RepID=UPI001FAAE5A9|nr:MMPL family transporter [Nocardioides sp. SR21]
MTQLLHRIGGFAALHPWRIVAAWLAVAAVVLAASASYGGDTSDSMEVPGLDSQQAADLLERASSDQAGLTAQLVVSPADQRALDGLRAEVLALPHVLDVGAPVTSADGRVALLPIQYPPLEELSAADLTALQEVRDRADADGPAQVEMRGDLVFAFAEPETGGEVVGLVAALVILLVAFGSVVAAGIPIGVALTGLATAVGAMTLAARFLDVPTWAPVLGSMVGLGVGIDYALFILTRHREQLADGVPLRESIARAVSTAGSSVVLAGGIVVVAILGLTVAGVPFMSAGAYAVSVIVLVMVLASITLLPALLAIAGNRVNGRRGSARRARSDARWQRRVEHVVSHPRVYAAGVLGLLVLLALPAFALRAGIPDDGTLPESRTERRAYDLLADGFGPGVNGQLLVVVDTEGDPAVLTPLRDALGADPGVASVLPATMEGDVATLVVTPTTGPQDAATYDTTERLRTEVLPSVLDGAHVGGQTAGFADVGARVNERLPWFVAAVLLLSSLLLALVFRSVLIPLQAALMNLLSIGAAYGVLVMVFQWGWGASLIGLESTVPVVSFIPMFMFAVVFGLSMDYEVFLLSRIREEYDATGDTRSAIVHGLARTGRVITSAAFIMIAVFLGFVLGEDPATKMFGLGLATAVLVDATLVRMVLLPATMQLLGRWNWWAPGAGRVRTGEPGSLVGSSVTDPSGAP